MRFEGPCGDSSGAEWLRGNLHAHSTLSDGWHPPQVVISEYAGRGYDFLMLSDHDVWVSPDDLARFDACGMILIPGNEISAGGPHILHVNAGCRVDPRPDRAAVLQTIAEDAGSFAIACHPNWTGIERRDGAMAFIEHLPYSQLAALRPYAGLEIYNGVTERLHGSALATDKWDRLLTEGRRVWGFANDDSHRLAGHDARKTKPDPTPLMQDDAGLGWNMVAVRERSAAAVVAALREGRFYPTTGVSIRRMVSDGSSIRVETDDAVRISAIRETGRVFAVGDGPVLQVDAPADAAYVRFECRGAGGKMAWTQPFFPGT